MILKFDKDKLERILYDYSKLTGLSIAIVDHDLEFIASSRGTGGRFCRMLQERDLANRCKCSDSYILKRCKASGKAEIHICHAGLCDMAVPLVSEGNVIAYIILGQIKSNADFNEIYDRISWYEKDMDDLREEYSKLVYYDDDGIKSVANIAVAVAAYILGDGVIKPQYNHVAEKAVRFISDNLQNDITVELLCKKMGVSKNLLYGAMRTAFGCTVKDYVAERRLTRALQLLSETDIPVCEIADSVGIYNHTYFSRLITGKTGMSPLKYRKTMKQL